MYGVSDKAVWVNLYMGNKADMKVGKKALTLTQETEYPWKGAVNLTLGLKGSLHTQMRLRIPGWCKDYSLTVNGMPVEAPVEKGYAVIERNWKNGDQIQLNLSMPVEVVAADPRVKEDEGLRAIQRGPVVYCLEEADNPKDFDELTLLADAELAMTTLPEKLGGIVEISAQTPGGVLTYIPYYAWDNREAGKMKVWVPYKEN